MRRTGIVLLSGLAIACGPTVQSPTDDTTGTSTTDSTSMTTLPSTSGTPPTSTAEATSNDPDTSDASDDVMRSDLNATPDVGDETCGDECGAVDVLFVVDNTSTMAPAQLALGRGAVGWIGDLLGDGAEYDVQIMVTTTDMGNPLCTPFQPAGYEPAMGAPTQAGCNARIDHFTGLGGNPVVADWACTTTCPNDVVPDDPFIAFGPGGVNVPDVPEVDIDLDGFPDSAIAQSLACLLPQGVNGCGYEAPLEAMLQALNPDAPWNTGERPFVRDGARLAIVLVTDEADCSVDDYSVMGDQAYFNENPDTGTPMASSALCWNAGVECDGPDAMGVYSDCMSVIGGPLEEIDRYVGYLRDELVVGQGKSIDFFSIGGVPEVTEYDANAPYAPTAGGLDDLVVRNWRDGAYPAGDIVPADADDGITAADKHFTFGIGPACTGENLADGFTQALPNPRLLEVCLALDDGAEQHCFVDSICTPTYDGSFGTLWGTMRAPMSD